MKTKDMVLAALFIALVYIATAFLRIPSPFAMGEGQLHTGTAIVFIVSVVYGPKMGALSTLGMVLFNLTHGLAPWAPINLVVRPVMAFLFGYIAYLGDARGEKWWLNTIAAIIGGTWMVAGMYFGQLLVFQLPWAVPVTAIPLNVLQVVFAIAVGVPLIAIMKRHKAKLR